MEERNLDQAIAQNLGADNPDAWTCMRLAAQLYLKDRLYGRAEAQTPRAESAPAYAFADGPTHRQDEIIVFAGKSEFARTVDGKEAAAIWPIIDDVFTLFAAIHPDIYQRAIAMIKSK